MVAGTTLEPVANELFARFGFFPAFFVAKNHHTLHAFLFLVMEGHKMASRQPFKGIFTSPLFPRVEILVLEIPYADQLREPTERGRRCRVVCAFHKTSKNYCL